MVSISAPRNVVVPVEDDEAQQGRDPGGRQHVHRVAGPPTQGPQGQVGKGQEPPGSGANPASWSR